MKCINCKRSFETLSRIHVWGVYRNMHIDQVIKVCADCEDFVLDNDKGLKAEFIGFTRPVMIEIKHFQALPRK